MPASARSRTAFGAAHATLHGHRQSVTRYRRDWALGTADEVAHAIRWIASDAGRQLADRLAELDLTTLWSWRCHEAVLPVGLEVARRLAAPLDLVLVRKIGAPGHEELAAGARGRRRAAGAGAERGCRAQLRHRPGVARPPAGAAARRDRAAPGALPRRSAARRRSPAGPRSWSTTGSPPAPPSGPPCTRCAGSGPGSWCWRCRWPRPRCWRGLRREADRIVCLHAPRDLMAVGQFYRDFRQIEDEEVVAMLKECWRGGRHLIADWPATHRRGAGRAGAAARAGRRSVTDARPDSAHRRRRHPRRPGHRPDLGGDRGRRARDPRSGPERPGGGADRLSLRAGLSVVPRDPGGPGGPGAAGAPRRIC